MSQNQPITIDTAPVPDGFEPIDKATYKWEQGKIIRNTAEYLIAFDKSNHEHFAIFVDCDWFSSAFNLTVVKPVTFNELRGLAEHAVKDFLGKNKKQLANETTAIKQSIVKELYTKLFAYWYKELSDIGLVDKASFQQEKERLEKENGHSGG